MYNSKKNKKLNDEIYIYMQKKDHFKFFNKWSKWNQTEVKTNYGNRFSEKNKTKTSYI